MFLAVGSGVGCVAVRAPCIKLILGVVGQLLLVFLTDLLLARRWCAGYGTALGRWCFGYGTTLVATCELGVVEMDLVVGILVEVRLVL
jgi:hypothetical protein